MDKTDGMPVQDEPVGRLEKLLVAAMGQVGKSCTKEFMAEMLAKAAVSPEGDLVDRLYELISNESEPALPDIAEGLAVVLNELYVQRRQPALDGLWVVMHGHNLTNSINAPSIEMDVPVDTIREHAVVMLDRIDEGTFGYLATLLSRGGELGDVWSTMFTEGGIDDITILDQRLRTIVTSELSWVGNLCRVMLIGELGGLKEWKVGEPVCELGQRCALVGPAHATYDYGDDLLHPPGCAGCNCFLSIVGGREPELRSLVTTDPGLARAMLALDVPKEYSTLLGVVDPHVTLQYFGKISTEQADLVREVVRNEVAGLHSFSVYLTGFIEELGPPDEKVAAATVRLTSDLQKLFDSTRTVTAQAGVPPDATWRDYKPHITLGEAGTVRPETVKDFGGLWLCEGVRFWYGSETEYFPFRM